MTLLNIGVITASAAQIIGAVVIALLLVSFSRAYPKSYLQHWTFGWMALSVYHLATAGGLALGLVGQSVTSPLRVIAACIAGISGYLQVGWFAFGVQELVRRRPIRLRQARAILAALGAAGLISAIVFLARSGPGEIYMARAGGRALVAFIVYIAAALALWNARRTRTGAGLGVLGGAFFFYGLEQLRYLNIVMSPLIDGPLRDRLTSLGFVDVLLQSVTAIGMVACLLEDEREAAALAGVEIEHLAYHDALTGLPNRPLFVDRLIVAIAQVHRKNERLAVLFLDVDRFKEINDSLGHSTGDQLLRGVAERIRRCVRDGDTLARFGGDEFTLLIPRVERVEDAAKIAQKIIDNMQLPFSINDLELFATVSIGIGIYPSDGPDAETLVRNADAAMYRAKEAGRDNYQMYAPAMNARALERLGLENMLRNAVTREELRLFYQPLVDTKTRVIVGFEALARWEHPELGLLLPAHFIPAAETSGLIVPIGKWALETACLQVKAWQKKLGRSLTVSVNLSARQFSQPDLIDQIRVVLDMTGFEPACLELEVTESSAMQNAENTIHALRELKRLGVRIAMDDFGTGYSSLNYLKRFPIDTLKLDQSFVRDMTEDHAAAAIVSAIITLSHDLELSVVAEGVETEEQLRMLEKHRCDRIQGFYFSRPLSIDEVEVFLSGKVDTHPRVLRRAESQISA